ncbi:MAG: hypothetical protein GVY33_07280 [Alphaproteobacteria bacterium]|nr:hypothetical protein [Alphaproteobacteria bacterium]
MDFLAAAPAPVRDGIPAPPEVAIDITARPAAAGEPIGVTVEAAVAEGEVEAVRLFHNGKRVAASAIRDRDGAGTTELTVRFAVPAVAGANVLKAVARGPGAIDSSPVTARVTVAGGAPAPRLGLAAVGIDDYRGRGMDLNYAVADARAVADTLPRRARAVFADADRTVVVDAEATRAGVLDAIARLEGTRPGDAAVLFLAGHGVPVDGEWHFVPHEVRDLRDTGAIRRRGISGDALAEGLVEVPARRLLLVVDSCYSGAILGDFDGFAQRRALHDLNRQSGVVVIAATRANQEAPEYPILGHGLLTSVLLRGLAPGDDGHPQADEAPADGRLTAVELKNFVERLVPEVALRLDQRLRGQGGQGAFAASVPVTPVGLSLGADFTLAR